MKWIAGLVLGVLLLAPATGRAEVKRLALSVRWSNVARSEGEVVKMKGRADGYDVEFGYTQLSSLESFSIDFRNGVSCSTMCEKGSTCSLSCTANQEAGLVSLLRLRGEWAKVDLVWNEETASQPAPAPAEREKPARRKIPVPLPKDSQGT